MLDPAWHDRLYPSNPQPPRHRRLGLRRRPLLQLASPSRRHRRSPTQCKAISLARPCTSCSATPPSACLLQITSPSRSRRGAPNQRSAISLAPPLEQRQCDTAALPPPGHLALTYLPPSIDLASGHLLCMAPAPTSPPPQVCYAFFFFFFPQMIIYRSLYVQLDVNVDCI